MTEMSSYPRTFRALSDENDVNISRAFAFTFSMRVDFFHRQCIQSYVLRLGNFTAIVKAT